MLLIITSGIVLHPARARLEEEQKRNQKPFDYYDILWRLSTVEVNEFKLVLFFLTSR